MSNNYTFQILDSNNLVSAAIKASITIDAQYVISLVSRHISWNGTMDFVVEIRPGSELTWSDADGLLPSFVQLGWTGNAWTNQTIAEAQTGVDPNPNRPDAGLTIYLADDGTIRNYGAPVWFDPNPGFTVNPAVPSGSHDFVGILTHEIFHSLGFINYTQEWAARMVAAGDISYFTGAQSGALYGGPIPFRTGYDHYGYAQDPSIPINRGLMYEYGNYQLNRWDIGRIDLAMLADMGYSIKTYDGLSLFEMIDTATNLTGTAAGETLYGDYHGNGLFGLGGNDRIEAGAGHDQLSGGDGNDLLIGGAGIDSFDGGADTADDPVTVYGDRISFAEPTATQGVVADLRTGTISNDGFGNVETMTGVESLGAGTVFADTFHGNDARNALLGSKGDILNGHGGDDVIQITAAPASVTGGAGSDLLELFSGGGFYVPDSNGDGILETAHAMANPWTIDLLSGTVIDGYGNSGSIAGIENVTASAVGGNVFGDGYANVFKGKEGVDILQGRGGDDILEGGGGTDQLSGGAGNDTIRGGAGSDTLIVEGAGTDVAEGGGGDWDRLIVDYGDSAGGIIMTLPGADAGGGSAGSISGADRSLGYTGIEILDVTTGSGNDVAFGGTDNSLSPGSGNSFRLGGGDDLFHYRGGSDVVDAGAGIDGFSGSLGANGVPIVWTLEPTIFPGIQSTYSSFEYFKSLTTGGGQDHITTANIAADDNITLGAGSDGVILWNGHDVVDGGAAGAGAIDSGFDTLILNYGQSTSAVRNVWALVADAAGYSGRFGDDDNGRSASFTAIDRFLIATGSGADSIATGDGNDEVRTGAGNDALATGGGNDFLDGGSGDDSMSGGTGNDIYVVGSAGDVVFESAGEGTDEVRTALAVYVLAANVENLTATSAAAHDFRGNSGNNIVTGGAGSDVLRLYDGGDDNVLAGAGNDNIFFIGALTLADVVNGGDGLDTLILQGPYGALALSASVTQIENVSILGGNNTNFGEPGTNRYDYVLTTNDANFAAGVQARINGAALLEGEDFTFDGSAETDAKYVVYGGKGKDTLTGGLGNDIFFYAEERFASGDVVNGGAGYDGMFLRGNYTIDFTAPGYTGLFTSIENLTLTSATDERYARGGGTEFDYNLTLSNAIVKPGEQLTISGTLLMASETMILDASQELDGLLRLFGGRAGDTLKGGGQVDLLYGGLGADILAGNGGADAFRYQDTAESNASTMDQILDFTPGTDKIELDRIDANALVGGDQGFSWIGSGAFTGQAGQLRAFQQGGSWIVEGDVNGDSVADLVIALTLQGPTPLSAGDFLL